MPRLSRGLLLQDFAREREDILDTLLTSAQRQSVLPLVLPGGSSDGQQSRQYRSSYTGQQMASESIVICALHHSIMLPEATTAGLGGMPALSEEASTGSGRSVDVVHVDIASLQHYKNRIGPELRQMRQAQGRNR